ncbi:MAG: tRNA epoxyqueuosine(34) reductase QueG [Anaerolineae bacterium]|nr:tRNA epoxyqueuosine(34) reductase QueG [Anaerolineae bacterium]MDW8172792.1 tRNA epoxyqueuosine(34) reductase QueG [Anaerolineae bacterium]
MSQPLLRRAWIHEQARRLGFNLVGVTAARPAPTLAAYERWIEQGMHAEMGYLARPDRLARRRDLSIILPHVRTLIVVGLDYSCLVDEAVLRDPLRGRIAAYAWGLDYHDIMQARLERLADALALHAQAQRVYVDTGAILERAHAQQAGLGFVGKNTLLIHPRRGSSFFIGEILTTADCDAHDAPHQSTMCGTCTRCLRACPTNAFPAPHVLDARRCISYHTIENKGWIDTSLRADFGNWVYGCDVCQDVCPWQRFAPATAEPALRPAEAWRCAPPLADLLTLDEAQFRARFAGSAILRTGRSRLVRNACVAAGNSGAREFIPPLLGLLEDDSPLVRGHAAWGLVRLWGDEARALLAARLPDEADEQVRAAWSELL